MHLDLEEWGRKPRGTAKVATLSRDEEQRLFRLWRTARDQAGNAELPEHARRTAAARAAHLREYLVRVNLLLIGYTYQMFRRRYAVTDRDVLLSEGMACLLRAVDGFDPARGYKFSTYAVRAIYNAFSCAAARESYNHQRLRICPLDGDISVNVNSEAAIAQERREALAAALAGNTALLTDEEWYIVEYRFMTPKPMTLAAVGRALGVTKERARQLQSRAILKLRAALAPGGDN